MTTPNKEIMNSKSARRGIDQSNDSTAPPSQNMTKVALTATNQGDAKKQIAKMYTGGELTGSKVTMAYNPDSMLDINVLLTELRSHHAAIDDGDLSKAEHMLWSQSIALQAMFADLATRAKNQTGIEQLQCLTGLALRAQSNCRATLLALGELKYPKQATFVKQANISHGPQQVNNGDGSTPKAIPRARKKVIPPSKLLEDQRHGGTNLDTGAAPTTAGGNPAVETVEAINRAEKPRG